MSSTRETSLSCCAFYFISSLGIIVDYVRYTYYIYYNFASVFLGWVGRVVLWSFMGRAAICLIICAEQGLDFWDIRVLAYLPVRVPPNPKTARSQAVFRMSGLRLIGSAVGGWVLCDIANFKSLSYNLLPCTLIESISPQIFTGCKMYPS